MQTINIKMIKILVEDHKSLKNQNALLYKLATLYRVNIHDRANLF